MLQLHTNCPAWVAMGCENTSSLRQCQCVLTQGHWSTNTSTTDNWDYKCNVPIRFCLSCQKRKENKTHTHKNNLKRNNLFKFYILCSTSEENKSQVKLTATSVRYMKCNMERRVSQPEKSGSQAAGMLRNTLVDIQCPEALCFEQSCSSY